MDNQNNETKKCKYCQTDIPKKAKICPNCKKKQGGKLKWILIGILVFFIFVGMFGGSNDDSTTQKADNSQKETVDATQKVVGNETVSEPKSESESKVETTSTEQNNQITVGDSFENNGLKVTLNETSVDFTDYENEYGLNTPNDGMKYIMASFTFENNSDSDKYVSIYDFDCYADNTTCEQKYGLDDSNFINTNISSVRNISFKVYFMVPINAQSIELEYETSIWSNKKVIIKLQ